MASHVVAEAEGLPEAFLRRLLTPLVDAGMLRALKGPSDGFTLARPAREITLLEIVEAVEGPIRPEVPEFDHGDRQLARKLAAVCDEAADRLRESLRKVSVADLAGGGKRGK